MALVVDTTVSYMGGSENDNVDFKLSKTLNQLTPDDIMSQDAYVGFTHFAVNSLAEGNLQSGIPENNPNHAFCYATDPYGFRWAGVSTKHWCYPANFAEGVYMRNILLYRPLNGGGANNYLNSNNRIVIDAIPRSDTSMQNLYLDDGSNYGPFVGILRSGVGEKRLTDYCYISPAIMMIVNNQLFIWLQGLAAPYSQFFCDSLTSQGYTGGVASNFRNESYHSLGFGWTMGYTTGSMLDNVVQDDIYGNGHIENVNFNGHIGGLNLSFGASNAHQRISESIIDNADKEFAKWFRAFTGFKFKVDNVWYKPIIIGGIVTGYTDDMTVPSEWDNWTKASGHNVPSGGGGGGGDDNDNTDPMTLYAAGFGAGLTHYYVFTKASGLAETISKALGTWDPTDPGAMGKDLFKNLISMKLTKVGSVPSTGSEQVTIYGVGLEDENGVAISAPVVSGNPTISFGPYTIDPKFGDFRDYAPFTKIDMYLPFCGWVALPSHCMGKSVSGEYIIDIISCTCKAVVKCGENVVAEAAGCCGLDVPFAAENVAMKMAGATMGLVSYGKAAVETSIGVGTAVASGGAQGAKQIVSGLGSVVSAGTQMAIQANSNYTEICGKTGDGCNIGGLGSVYILIKRPLYGDYTEENHYTPAGFAHSVGYLSMKNARVGDCTGLIVCDNIDTSGIASATERERQMIRNMLQSGIIVNSPPAP